MNTKVHKLKKTKDVKEIEDLRKAYDFAKDNPLNEKNFLKAHEILSQTLLIKANR
ncbi:MAG: hypothetical protein LBF15_03350 [Candidatus Peribacteria bacterium]|jgi:hypothetical protein|nr:hypothetical protein [Candidatus Peribacteria bacterium]